MSYKNRLDSLKNDKQLFKAEDRSEEIQKDMMNAFADGSVFGELIAEAVTATLGKAIDKFGLDNLVSGGIDGFKSMVGDAVKTALQSNELLGQFSEKMASREAGNEKSQGQEMGA